MFSSLLMSWINSKKFTSCIISVGIASKIALSICVLPILINNYCFVPISVSLLALGQNSSNLSCMGKAQLSIVSMNIFSSSKLSNNTHMLLHCAFIAMCKIRKINECYAQINKPLGIQFHLKIWDVNLSIRSVYIFCCRLIGLIYWGLIGRWSLWESWLPK